MHVAALLSATFNNVEKHLTNLENNQLIIRFFEFIKQLGLPKDTRILISKQYGLHMGYSKFVGPSVSL